MQRARVQYHMLQLRVGMSQLKIPHAVTKTQSSQINKYFFKSTCMNFFKNVTGDGQ